MKNIFLVLGILFCSGSLACSEEQAPESSSEGFVPPVLHDMGKASRLEEKSVEFEELLETIDTKVDEGKVLVSASNQRIEEYLSGEVLTEENLKDEHIEEFDVQEFFEKYQVSCNMPTYEHLAEKVALLQGIVAIQDVHLQRCEKMLELNDISISLLNSQLNFYQMLQSTESLLYLSRFQTTKTSP